MLSRPGTTGLTRGAKTTRGSAAFIPRWTLSVPAAPTTKPAVPSPLMVDPYIPSSDPWGAQLSVSGAIEITHVFLCQGPGGGGLIGNLFTRRTSPESLVGTEACSLSLYSSLICGHPGPKHSNRARQIPPNSCLANHLT